MHSLKPVDSLKGEGIVDKIRKFQLLMYSVPRI